MTLYKIIGRHSPAARFDEVYEAGLSARNSSIGGTYGNWTNISDAPLFQPFHDAERSYLTFMALAALGSTNVPDGVLARAREAYVENLAAALVTEIEVSNKARSLDDVRPARYDKSRLARAVETAIGAVDTAIGLAAKRGLAR